MELIKVEEGKGFRVTYTNVAVTTQIREEFIEALNPTVKLFLSSTPPPTSETIKTNFANACKISLISR